MTLPLLTDPPAFYVVAIAVLSILAFAIFVGNRIIGFLRNLRNYRNGR